MLRSIDLLDALSVTEIVQLKDSNNVEIQRLATKLRDPLSKEFEVVSPFFAMRIHLDTKLEAIINARLLEALDNAPNLNKQDA